MQRVPETCACDERLEQIRRPILNNNKSSTFLLSRGIYVCWISLNRLRSLSKRRDPPCQLVANNMSLLRCPRQVSISVLSVGPFVDSTPSLRYRSTIRESDPDDGWREVKKVKPSSDRL